jgi:predicted Zn-dependent protease
MRRIVMLLEGSLGHFSSVALIWVATSFLQFVAYPASAQMRTGLDYYAPRSGVDTEAFNAVMTHHFGPGREEVAIGRFGAALAHFEFLLNYFPNHPQTLVELSELCLKWKSPICDAAAERRFQAAIQRNPEAAQSYVVQGLYFHRNNRLDEAVKSYSRAIELAPNSINAHYNLGLAYTDLQQYDLANQHAQKAYALGVSLPGLRARLEKAGKWNPNVTLPAEAKPAGEPAAPASPEKAPD